MPGQNPGSRSKKGLPKRTGSAHRKEARARSWLRARKRHEAHKKAQEARRRENVARRQAGIPTPWEAARIARRAARVGKHRTVKPLEDL